MDNTLSEHSQFLINCAKQQLEAATQTAGQLLDILSDPDIAFEIVELWGTQESEKGIDRLLTYNKAMNKYPIYASKRALLTELGRIKHGILV